MAIVRSAGVRSGHLYSLSRFQRPLSRLANVIPAALVVIGFFSPWMDGTDAFDLRTFSGFEFARLVRNFEITADSASATGQIRVTALAIYLVPALAINGTLMLQLSAFAGALHRAASVALLLAAIYILSMLSALSVLSVIPSNQFADVVGLPSWGFGLTLSGALLLGWLGRIEMRKARLRSAEPD